MNGIKPDPDVKLDPDSMTPSGSGYMDDDFYEDTGELQLPPRNKNKDVWLTRIPKWLFERVSKWEDFAEGTDDDQIVIGEVLYFPYESRNCKVSEKEPMRVFLNQRWQEKTKLPQAFDIEPAQNKDDDVLGSTYVFTEKDLPGYRPNGLGQGKMGASGSFGVQDPKAKVQKRTKYKKAIPKQTALIGNATREYTAKPLQTKEFIAFNKSRTRQAIQGANTKSNIVDTMYDTSLSVNVQKMFQNFIKPVRAPKAQLNKAARIPKNELIDLLHSCFDQYAYWPMKALKAKTKQPEAYLKEVLVDIADLIKSGSFASSWKRSAMYDKNAVNQVQGMAPEMEDSGDEEMEMEDVV